MTDSRATLNRREAAKVANSKSHLPHGGKELKPKQVERSAAKQQSMSDQQRDNRLKKEAAKDAKKKK